MTVLRLRRSRWRIQSGLIALVATFCSVAGVGLLGSSEARAAPLAAGSGPATSLEWSQVSVLIQPPPLAYASAVYDSDNNTVVLFGGVAADGRFSNDTWVWNGSSWIDFPASQTQAPPGLEMASMAFDPDLHELILFGGQEAGGQFNGYTWAWNGASWYEESPNSSPPPREAAALAADGSELVLFGGTGDAGPPADPPATSGPAPSSTTPTSATPTVLGDTWVWDGLNWTESDGAGPGARSGPAMSYDSAKHELVLFGGEATPANAPSERLLADTWTMNGSGWKRASPHQSPSARVGAAMADDPDAGGVVLTTGGLGVQRAGADSWVWSGANWARAPTTLEGPSPRSGAAAAYDAANHQLVLFGGESPRRTVLGDTFVLSTGLSGAGPGRSAPTSGAGGAPPPGSTPSIRPGSTSSSSQPGSTQVPPAARRSSPGGSTPIAPAPLVVHRNQKISLSTSGFKAGAPIEIWFDSDPQLVARTTADGAGYFRASVTVPTTATFGTHHFEAIGEDSSGRPRTWPVLVKVVKAGHPRATTRQTMILIGVAVLIPLAAWLILAASDRTRARTRRRHRLEQVPE
jgi:hypothetical protein